MIIASLLEDQKIEKRISVTPEIAKKYIELGFEVHIVENYVNILEQWLIQCSEVCEIESLRHFCMTSKDFA